MICLCPHVVGAIVSIVKALEPHESYTHVFLGKPGDEGSQRFDAFRKGDGTWQIVLERYTQMDGQFTDFREWSSMVTGYHANGDPIAPAEAFAATSGEVTEAVGQVVDFAWWNEIHDDGHPGASLLWWVWDQ